MENKSMRQYTSPQNVSVFMGQLRCSRVSSLSVYWVSVVRCQECEWATDKACSSSETIQSATVVHRWKTCQHANKAMISYD